MDNNNNQNPTTPVAPATDPMAQPTPAAPAGEMPQPAADPMAPVTTPETPAPVDPNQPINPAGGETTPPATGTGDTGMGGGTPPTGTTA